MEGDGLTYKQWKTLLKAQGRFVLIPNVAATDLFIDSVHECPFINTVPNSAAHKARVEACKQHLKTKLIPCYEARHKHPARLKMGDYCLIVQAKQ